MATLTNIFGTIYDATGAKVTQGAVSLTLQQDMVSVDGTKVAPFTVSLSLAPLSTPTGVSVTPQGTPGSTTYGYRIAAKDGGGGTTLASATVQTTTGNATLSGTNFNRIAWTAVTGAATYEVYGRTSGSELRLTTVTSPTYDDDGSASPIGALPAANTSGGYISRSVYATVGASPAGLSYYVEYDPAPADTSKPASQKDGFWYNYWAVPNEASVPVGNFVSALRGQPSANYMPVGGTVTVNGDEITLGNVAAATTKQVIANQVGVDKPKIRFNVSTSYWELSHDGVTYNTIAAGSFASTGGNTFTGAQLLPSGSAGAPSLSFSGDTTTGFWRDAANAFNYVYSGLNSVRFYNGLQLYGTHPLAWAAGDPTVTSRDLLLYRDDAGALAQRNTTNAQKFRVYNTFTDSGNYERLSMISGGTYYGIFTEQAGSGTSRALFIGTSGASYLYFRTNNSDRWFVHSDGSFQPVDDITHNIGAPSKRPLNLYLGGILSVSGLGTHTLNAGGTGGNVLSVANSTAGVGNYATVRALNDGGVGAYLSAISSTWTGGVPHVANCGTVESTGAGGLSVAASHASGAIRFYTGGSSRLSMPSDAAGLTFPATQAASSDANTLDDYEEGTWTPAISFGGASTGVTYSTQTGTYTKIGNLVYAQLQIVLTSNGTATGAVTISPLPFTVSGIPMSGVIDCFNFIGVTGAPYVVASGNVLYLSQSSATSRVALTDANVADNLDLRASLTYRV